MLKHYLRMRNFVDEQTGASLAEYGMLVALIAVICIAAVGLLGTNVRDALQDAANGIAGIGGG